MRTAKKAVFSFLIFLCATLVLQPSVSVSASPGVLATVINTATVYNLPTANSNTLGTLVAGQSWFVIGMDLSGKWFQVQLPAGATGWVASSTFNLVNTLLPIGVSTSGVSIQVAVTASTPIYNAPTLNSNTLGSTGAGQVWFALGTDTTGKWIEIQITPGKNGWVPASTLNLASVTLPVAADALGMTAQVQVTANVSVYSEPTTNSNVDGAIVPGQTWLALGTDTTKRWVEIQITPGSDVWAVSSAFNLTNVQLPVVAGLVGATSTGGRFGVFRYRVVAGDTLGILAIRFRTTIAVLMRLNRISDPNLIFVGQVLLIPG